MKTTTELQKQPQSEINQFAKDLFVILGSDKGMLWWGSRRFGQYGVAEIAMLEGGNRRQAVKATIGMPMYGQSGYSISFYANHNDLPIYTELDISAERVLQLMLEFNGLESLNDKHWTEWLPIAAVVMLFLSTIAQYSR